MLFPMEAELTLLKKRTKTSIGSLSSIFLTKLYPSTTALSQNLL
jgi:hypothetical protein